MASGKKTVSRERGNSNGQPVNYAALARELMDEANRIPDDWGGCMTVSEVAELLGIQTPQAGRVIRELPRKPRLINGKRGYVVPAKGVYELVKERLGGEV